MIQFFPTVLCTAPAVFTSLTFLYSFQKCHSYALLQKVRKESYLKRIIRISIQFIDSAFFQLFCSSFTFLKKGKQQMIEFFSHSKTVCTFLFVFIQKRHFLIAMVNWFSSFQ